MKQQNFEMEDFLNLYEKKNKKNTFWLESMIKGMKDDIEIKGGMEKACPASIEMLKKWENRLKDK